MCNVTTPPKAATIVLLVTLGVIGAVPVVSWFLFESDESHILAVWLAGAAGLGMLCGYTTGASEHTGAGTELIKFLGAGILVPLLAGIATLLQRPQKTAETYTYTPSDQVATKVVDTTFPAESALSHPLLILGSFFLFTQFSPQSEFLLE